MFKQALDGHLLLLIKKLSEFKQISDKFYLAGGTALTLHIGHRKSEDIDLFSSEEFNSEEVAQIIISAGGAILVNEERTIHAIIDKVKLSFIYYPYNVLQEFVLFGLLKVASIQDIACMKTIAIAQRAEKKDFFDIFELFKIISPAELKELVVQKYGADRINLYHIAKSFVYFDEAEDSPDPISLNGTGWNTVKQFLYTMESEISNNFIG